jgi:hypothetical protein
MGRELRVFFKLSESTFDLWKFFSVVNKSAPEIRSDTYFHLNDKRFGLKLRSRHTIELKVLDQQQDTNTNTNANTNAKVENWAKIVHIPLNSNVEGVRNWHDELKPLLGNSSAGKRVVELLHGFDSKNLIPISKQRTQQYLNYAGGCFAGLPFVCYLLFVLISKQRAS